MPRALVINGVHRDFAMNPSEVEPYLAPTVFPTQRIENASPAPCRCGRRMTTEVASYVAPTIWDDTTPPHGEARPVTNSGVETPCVAPKVFD
jgi:hypothetical protein